MGTHFDQLLDATIQHLERLRSSGVRHVAVSPDVLNALATAAPKITANNNPAPRSLSPSVAPVARTATPEIKPPAITRPAPLVAPAKAPATDLGLSALAATPAPVAAPAPAVPLTPRSATEKAAAFADLRQRALACRKCEHLASSRKNVVFGVGNPDADLMFVGEAPGADEDTQGEPFVGKAGELLTKVIQAMGLKRGDVYIANILKCRPDTPGETTGNRKPEPEEMATCIPYLHEQIDLIQPKVLVALGGTAMEGLLNKTGITKLRGHWHTYRGIPLMPTYHPAFLLRNQAMSEKRKIWEDMMQVMEKLSLPISEKQRSYFLR